MNVLDTSYLVDYERGRESARRYFEDHGAEEFVASTISMFELAFGVVWDSDRDLHKLRESLLWIEFLEFSVADAIEGARIQGELQHDEIRLPIGDVMIAGVARNRGATLVAGDDHFTRIDDLRFDNHRRR